MRSEREWHPIGIITPVEFSLNEAHKKKIRAVIGQDHQKAEEFLLAIESAIRYAKGAHKLREDGKPASIRKNLKKVLHITDKLIESLCTLDLHSRYLLNDNDIGLNYIEILNSTIKHRNIICSALDTGNRYPKRGNLYQGHCNFLAYLVAQAITNILELKPTLYHDNPSTIGTARTDKYAQCLEIALKAASFKKGRKISSENLFYLMKEGMRTLEESEIDRHLTIFRKGSW